MQTEIIGDSRGAKKEIRKPGARHFQESRGQWRNNGEVIIDDGMEH